MVKNSLSIEEIKRYIGSRTIIASVSGGKDSTSMALWLKENGFNYQPVFINTGWEHPCTIDYINDYLPQHIGDITTISGPGMMELVQARGRFPSPTVRFCTGELKIRPMQRYIRGQVSDVVNACHVCRLLLPLSLRPRSSE